jgi:hypothetical protein
LGWVEAGSSFHTRFEVLYALGEVAHDLRQLTGAEQNQDDRQDHHPVC